MTYFDKLRPRIDIESCDCFAPERLLLVYTLTDNPIHCFECKGEVDAERINLSEQDVAGVCDWIQQFSSLYELWLNSGEYESWAKKQLLKANGSVNRTGLLAASLLSKKMPTYYWWFHDSEDEEPETCYKCGETLSAAARHGIAQCNACRIII